jgi:hypothetical protein
LSACIDADGSGGKSEQCAAAICHSNKKNRNAITFFCGQTTDSGGGGVLYSLASELGKLNLCSPVYFVAPCTLNGMNLIFANLVKGVFVEGDRDDDDDDVVVFVDEDDDDDVIVVFRQEHQNYARRTN